MINVDRYAKIAPKKMGGIEMISLEENGQVNMKALEIEDIVDISLLQKFQDNFAVGVNCASVTVNRSGQPITKPSSYTRFCTDFVHRSSVGDRRCAESHNRMGEEAARTGRPYVGTCHAGLIDFAAPIIVNGELLGTVLGGQVLSAPPKEDNYRSVAREIGADEEKMAGAANEVKITEMENIRAAAEVLFIVVNALAQNGYTKLQLESIAQKLASKFVEVSATLEELASSAQSIQMEQSGLNQEIAQIGEFNSKITHVLGLINKISMNTKILGINSSIEAAHAGEAGVGFAVVAREINNLSENSKQMADEIAQLTKKISESIHSTVTHSEVTLCTSNEQAKALEDIAVSVQQITYLAEELNDLTNVAVSE